MRFARALGAAVLFAMVAAASAQSGRRADTVEALEAERESPWLIVPVLSIDPKLGTSIGVMAGYMRPFDEKSLLSILVANAQWTSTGSVIGGLFGTASWAQDHHRLVAGFV